MAIITAAGLVNLNGFTPPFNKNGSIVTLKKISETDWLLFGDIGEGESEGFPYGGDFEWQYEYEGYNSSPPVGFNDGVDDLDISIPLDTSGSIVFRPYGGGVVVPEPNPPWLRVQLSGDFTGLEYVVTYGDQSQASGTIVGGSFFFQTEEKGGFTSLEIQRRTSSVPILGWISFNWTAPL